MDALGLLPNALFTGHLNAKAATSRGLSPELWYKAAQSMLPSDGYPGIFVFDDFTRAGGYAGGVSGGVALPSVAGPAMNGYAVYTDTATTASSISQVDNVTGGVQRLTANTTDNHLAIMNTGCLGEISRTAGEKCITIFEARYALPTQVTTGSTFVGLSTQNMVADGGLIVDTGLPIAAGGVIGFHTPDADPDGVDFIYQAASQTMQVRISDLHTAVAGTMVKLGFIYNPLAPIDKRITVYLNGVKKTTYVTDTLMSAATFPNSTHMGVCLAAKSDGGSVARSLDVDWVAYFQGSVIA